LDQRPNQILYVGETIVERHTSKLLKVVCRVNHLIKEIKMLNVTLNEINMLTENLKEIINKLRRELNYPTVKNEKIIVFEFDSKEKMNLFISKIKEIKKPLGY